MTSWPKPYAAHEVHIGPARGRREIWRVLLTSGLVIGCFYMTPLLVASVAGDQALDSYLQGDRPAALFVALASFALPAAVLCWAVTRVHHRPPLTLLGARRNATPLFRSVALAVLGVLLLTEILPPWPISDDYPAITRPVASWMIALPFAAVATLIQTGTEELFYRGYLQQQLAALSSRRIVWMGLPSLLFALSHGWNTPGSLDAAVYIVWTFLFGLACADLTARTGSLIPAWALHFANNMIAFCLYGVEGGWSTGFALFLFPADAWADTYVTDPGAIFIGLFYLLFELPYVLIMWLAARLVLRR